MSAPRQSAKPILPHSPRKEFRNIGVSDLRHYRLPLAGIVSILHRVSGLVLFLALPFCAFLLNESLRSASTYEGLMAVLAHPLAKLMALALAWGFLHHLCAGIRHLFLDLHLGLEKTQSHQSAIAVLFASLLLTLSVLYFLW